MAPSLRGRLVCFYCGSRSAQTRRPNLSNWQCEKCEAVNHLDENGEITDPPATGDYTNARYAQSLQRPISPLLDKPDDSLFCQTCLKNQHVFAETLAGYFPSQDAPNFAEFEKAYPAYRKDLEERYPQVCEQCAPMVQERIRATGYAAKTDHLRRMMDRTRGHGVSREKSSWKSTLAFAGGTAWFMSIVGQIAWDGLVLSTAGKEHEGLLEEDITFAGCAQQAMRGSDLAPGCTKLATPIAGAALLLGISSIWWNPKLQETSRRRGGRMTGIWEYYKLQLLLLAVRSLAYLYLDRTSSMDLNRETTRGIHAFMMFFCVLLTIMSFRTIGIDYTPRIVFQDSPAPLMSEVRTIQPGSAKQSNTYTTSSTSGPRPFSVNDFAPSSRQQYPTRYQPLHQPPTPPPEDDDDEAMDWTPSQQSTLRTATYRPSSSAFEQPQQNPFHGHLPADAVSQEHRLRNPPNKPTFRKASETSKQNFFRPPKRNARDVDTASDVGTEYEPSLAETVSPTGPRFADPKLHFPSDQTPVTGLERLLANTFSLSDEPSEIRTTQQNQAEAYRERQNFENGDYAKWHRVPILLLLTASYFFWANTLKPSLAAYEVQIQLATLFIAVLASIRSLFLALCKDIAVWSGSDILIFTAELIASITLLLTTGDPSRSPFWNVNPAALQSAGSSLIATLAVQELWLLIQDVRTVLRDVKSAPTHSQDMEPLPPPARSESRPKHPARRNEDPGFYQIANAVVHASADAPRSTRSTTLKNTTAAPNDGFGGLSLATNTNTGFGSLSLSGNNGNNHITGIESLSLGQPRRRNRDGMW